MVLQSALIYGLSETPAHEPPLLRSGNESGHACSYDLVEPDFGGDVVPNLADGVLRQRGNIEVLPDALSFGRGRQESGVTLYSPRQGNPRRRLVDAMGNRFGS